MYSNGINVLSEPPCPITLKSYRCIPEGIERSQIFPTVYGNRISTAFS